MKDFTLGFFVCLCLVLLTAMAPIHIADNEMANIYAFIQKPTFKIETSTPSIGSVAIGQPVWVQTSDGNVWLYTKNSKSVFKKIELR